MKTTRFLLLLSTLVSGLALAAPGEKNASPNPTAQSGEGQRVDESKLNETWNSLSSHEKAAAIRLHHALRQMPTEERKFIHERIERFMRMSPDERHWLKENNERWQKMSADERHQAREKFLQHRKEFEEKWRKEHPGEEPPPFLSHPKSEQKNNPNPQETKP